MWKIFKSSNTLNTTIHTIVITVTNQNQEIDTLKISQNDDGTFSLDWSPNDPKWSWMNNLTSKEMQIIVKQAIKCHIEELDK